VTRRLLASLLACVAAAGCATTPQSEVRQQWDDTTPAERASICSAYDLFGEAALERILVDFVPDETEGVAELVAILREEC